VGALKYYPYRFRDIFIEKPWGGMGLATRLGKQLPSGEPIGESWEISDRDAHMSVVASGPEEGRTIRELLQADREGMLGPQVARLFPDRFPLLVKYIDARKILSLQVHPDDTYAMENENGEWGKMEAWYIIDAEPGAFVYRGTKPGTERKTFLRLLEEQRLEECLSKVKVAAGDVVFIPPGCLHATGAGILFCEIQQNSDLTYRVYDWGRMGLDGRPRELHIEKALDVIDWDLQPGYVQARAGGAPGDERRVELLLECPKFIMDRLKLPAGETNSADMTGRFHIICVIGGEGRIVCPLGNAPPVTITKGQTYLIPSALESYEIIAEDALVAVRAQLPRKKP